MESILHFDDGAHFEDVALSHGWLFLPPFSWDAGTRVLTRWERLRSGAVVSLSLTGVEGGVRLRSAVRGADAAELEARARRMLAMGTDLSGFHKLCADVPGLAEAAARRRGRFLRCPTVWEDLVKTLFTVNTTWRQTIGMTARLLELCGPGEGPHPFPEPHEVAPLEESLLRERCRVGFRAGPLAALARAMADGTLDLEALREPSLPDAEVEARLHALRGIGPYAAANVMMLLGRHDHLPVDSWFRRTVRDGWFGGRDVPDRELTAAFERFRPYRTLVYSFYDWKGADRQDLWKGEDARPDYHDVGDRDTHEVRPIPLEGRKSG